MTKLKGKKTTEVDLVEVEGYVYCHAHGAVHPEDPDPFDMGEDCKSHWCVLYAEKGEYAL